MSVILLNSKLQDLINPSLEQLKQFTSEDVPAISWRV